jgi:hypothetical protein
MVTSPNYEMSNIKMSYIEGIPTVENIQSTFIKQIQFKYISLDQTLERTTDTKMLKIMILGNTSLPFNFSKFVTRVHRC